MWPSGWRMDAACTWAQYLSSLLCQPVVLTVLEAGSGLVKWERGRKGLDREKERGRDSVRWRRGCVCIMVRYCSSRSISTFGQEALTVAVVRTPPSPPPLKEQRHTPYRSRWDQTVEGRVPREMYVWVSKGGEAGEGSKQKLQGRSKAHEAPYARARNETTRSLCYPVTLPRGWVYYFVSTK